ncbi:hypothetical protein CRUP_026377 [Coryphaenoides rupestris]|nr:hypothetical protein CRUP_026377 [Coryphaenoides rupestris]
MAKTVLRKKQQLLERLTDDDFRKAEEFVAIMRLLYTSTLAISSEKSPTCGQTLPILGKLEVHFTVAEEDTMFTTAVKDKPPSHKRAKKSALEELFEEEDQELQAATSTTSGLSMAERVHQEIHFFNFRNFHPCSQQLRNNSTSRVIVAKPPLPAGPFISCREWDT